MSPKMIQTSGQCLCGKVKIAIDAVPIRMGQCHCRDCQTASGSGHMSLAFFKADDVSITGEVAGYAVTTDLGNTATRHFCPHCGSRISGVNSAREGIIAVAIGLLDDRSWFKPAAVVYCKNRDDWDNTSVSIPNFEAMPGG